MKTIKLEIPLVDADEFETAYPGGYIQLQLTSGQGIILKRMLAGLKLEGAVLQVGRSVNSTADVIKYILEQAERLDTQI